MMLIVCNIYSSKYICFIKMIFYYKYNTQNTINISLDNEQLESPQIFIFKILKLESALYHYYVLTVPRELTPQQNSELKAPGSAGSSSITLAYWTVCVAMTATSTCIGVNALNQLISIFMSVWSSLIQLCCKDNTKSQIHIIFKITVYSMKEFIHIYLFNIVINIL